MDLHTVTALTYEKEAEENLGRGRSDLARENYIDAAISYELSSKSAPANTPPSEVAAGYGLAAANYRRAGDRPAACAALNKAGAPDWERESYGCPLRK